MRFYSRIMLIVLFWLPAGTALANSLHRLEVITDDASDRIIFEFDHRADYKMTSPAIDVVEIAFTDAELSPEFQLPGMPSGLKVVTNMESRIDAKGRLVVTVHLQREAEPTGITLCATPWKYAMDLAPKLTNGDAARPRYIPGDRPLHTRYTTVNPESASQVQLSRWTLTLLILFAFGGGIASVFGMRRLRRFVWGEPVRAPEKRPVPVSSVTALNHELERDLARLKRTVEREQAEPWSALSLVEERQQLILKLIREGRDLNAVAEALNLPPDDIRKMLDRHP